MLRLGVKYAFEIANADAVSLNVFQENPGAKKCYEKVGFKERKKVKRKCFPVSGRILGKVQYVYDPELKFGERCFKVLCLEELQIVQKNL